jgi:hypothetical protein
MSSKIVNKKSEKTFVNPIKSPSISPKKLLRVSISRNGEY